MAAPSSEQVIQAQCVKIRDEQQFTENFVTMWNAFVWLPVEPRMGAIAKFFKEAVFVFFDLYGGNDPENHFHMPIEAMRFFGPRKHLRAEFRIWMTGEAF